MPAYASFDVASFLAEPPGSVVGQLEIAYAHDGFVSQYTSQSRAWSDSVPLIQSQLALVVADHRAAASWNVHLELPLYRLRKRVDLVMLTDAAIVVVELKVGESTFLGSDMRQAEEYALDLRDFHSGSLDQCIVPCLWCTDAGPTHSYSTIAGFGVSTVHTLGREDLPRLLRQLATLPASASLVRDSWEHSAYKPVPSVIEAATTIFGDHDVRSIARADASNLDQTAARVVELIASARTMGHRALIFVTGVPGSGKTLAGLQSVHDAVATGGEDEGDIVYLSGNTPLVTVLREPLARDRHSRSAGTSKRRTIAEVRRDVRARIQHIINFLRDAVSGDSASAPHEHAIVFDEAQRAWDEKQGQKKFSRAASEPQLLLEIMSRHTDWCSLVCLVGGGQEINSGEDGVAGWGDALRNLDPNVSKSWQIHAPSQIAHGDNTTGGLALGSLPECIAIHGDDALRLQVSLRSYRSPRLADWVDAVLRGAPNEAADLSRELSRYPIVLSRSLDDARSWLLRHGRGHRRFGLVASSGARRLRAEGLGVSLNATDGDKIAHWYLNDRDDIRSSMALEVTANEYTSQGLELDFVGVCWGGDFLRSSETGTWMTRRLHGAQWDNVQKPTGQRFTRNSYRVLLTRAREGMVLWVPRGNSSDPTRSPDTLDATADFLVACGASPVGTSELD